MTYSTRVCRETRGSTMADLNITFLCGLRGYHEYRNVWTPTLNEVLRARQERNNPYDRYAIAALKHQSETHREQVVDHLPREISRYTWFIINHGAEVLVQVVDVNHRRSFLVQGGLEIPIEVSIVMPYLDANKQALEIYRTLISEHYEEPVDGNFADATAAILAEINASSTDESDTDTEEETVPT